MKYTYSFLLLAILSVFNTARAQVLTLTPTPTATSCAGLNDGLVAVGVTGCPGPYTFTSVPSVPFTQAGTTLSGFPAGTYTINATSTSASSNVLFASNFSNPSQWTLNQVTGAEGADPNPWVIGGGAPYPGGTCGAAAPSALYIQCQGIICEFFGGGGPVFNASAATITDRATNTAADISSIGFNNVKVKFAWSCEGAASAFGSLRYSINSGTNWIDLPAQYFGDANWTCEEVTLPVTCNNISTLKIAFRWKNASAGSDPPFAVTNVSVEGTPTGGGGSCAGSVSVTIPEGNPVNLPVSPSGAQTLCTGSNLTLTAAAGFNTYLWSNGTQTAALNITAPGTYSVTAISAAGCDAVSSSVAVTAGTTVVVNVASSGPLTLCPGGSLTLTADPGFLTYTWSNSQSGQVLTVTSPGTYSVLTTGGAGCPGQSAAVTVLAATTGSLTVTPAGPLTVCGDATLTLTAASGYTNYQWTGGAGGTGATFVVSAPGTYSVSADDPGGCSVTSTNIEVTAGVPFNLIVNPNHSVSFCEGTSVDLVADPGFSDYVWSNAEEGEILTVTEPGDYSVSALNESGCTGVSDIIVVNQTPLPDAGFTSFQAGLEYQVQFISDVLPGTHFWNFGGANTSTEPSPVFIFAFDATWPVMHVVSNSCGIDTFLVDLVVIKTSINDIPGVSASLYPNPGHASFTIEGNSQAQLDVKVRIFNGTGQCVEVKNLKLKGSFEKSFNMNDYAPGIYTIVLESGSDKLVKRWIKE